MLTLRQHELVFLLSSSDPRLIKRGLQRICDAIERGSRVDLVRDPVVFGLIGRLRDHEDRLVRLWLYKLAGLAKIRPWGAWLKPRVVSREPDAENLTWAFGALSALEGSMTASRLLYESGREPRAPAFVIASDYFTGMTPLDPAILDKAMDGDDSLAHQWLSMRHGQAPHAVPLGVLRQLTTSEDDIVVEYALWAAHRDSHASVLDVSFDPADFKYKTPNVRRWYMRLLLRDAENLIPYQDLVNDAMRDSSNIVREGVALGLQNARLPPYLALPTAEWFTEEADPLVRLSLRKLVIANGRLLPLKGLAAQARSELDEQFGRAYGQAPARILVPTRPRPRNEPTLDAVPVIVSDIEEQVYVLGLDTVAFSTYNDRRQYAIFRDILDALQHQDLTRNQHATDLCVLPTGDGVFVCFRGVANRLSPLTLAVTLNQDFLTLRKYELRFGINAGPATWITLRGGGSQVISHAINWAARVMSSAEGAQVRVSQSYYETIVRPAGDDLRGVKFREAEPAIAKHDEPLRTWIAEPV